LGSGLGSLESAALLVEFFFFHLLITYATPKKQTPPAAAISEISVASRASSPAVLLGGSMTTLTITGERVGIVGKTDLLFESVGTLLGAVSSEGRVGDVLGMKSALLDGSPLGAPILGSLPCDGVRVVGDVLGAFKLLPCGSDGTADGTCVSLSDIVGAIDGPNKSST